MISSHSKGQKQNDKNDYKHQTDPLSQSSHSILDHIGEYILNQ